MTANELRQKYLDFFKSKDHAVIASASIIPENDPSVLFTTAGMQPLVPFLLGEKHPQGVRLASAQKCIRTGDIDEVGDTTHHTFFEMLGNWSLGDYFKQESIAMSYEFLTKTLNIPVERLAVSVFAGDDDAPKDEEALNFWLEKGVPEERVAFLDKEENWWPAGGKNPGPQGPDTEIFYWIDNNEPAPAKFDSEDDRWVEIWNNVFMQFNKTEDGQYVPLEQKNVDTGMGLERTTAVLNGLEDNYQTDLFWPIIEKLQEISGQKYENNRKAFRIVADHIKAAVMIMGDRNGVAPSNLDQGYIVRRLIRRSIRTAKEINIEKDFTLELVESILSIYQDIYPEVKERESFVRDELQKEEEKFSKTLEKGLKILSREMKAQIKKVGEKNVVNKIDLEEWKEDVPFDWDDFSGYWFAKFYQTYGFPFEMAVEELEKVKGEIPEVYFDKFKKEFDEEMAKHQELSRKGAEQKFKGGLADTSEETAKLHTATHLLQAALQKVLGDHVAQKGSNITADRLRFDFTHGEKMTDEQKKEVEDLVNKWIQADYEVKCEELPYDEAKKRGAMGLFEDKYGDVVKVYSVGDVSMELCGGPHAKRTGELGHFKIKKEESSSAGIRRIKAVLK